MRNRKIILAGAALIALAAILAIVWSVWFSPTKVAFVNWQISELGQISRSNDSRSVKISELPADRLHEAGRYDMVFVNGMGLRITADQSASGDHSRDQSGQ